MLKSENIHIKKITSLISPAELKKELPISEEQIKKVLLFRETIINIINGDDPRKLAIIGPCSIHDIKAAHEYAHLLKELSLKVQDKVFLVMRVYFEKPRTVIGWKGLINDPDMDNTCNMNKGLKIARKLLLDLTNLGVPTATEVLDPISPQYIADLLAWASIGARTTESQTHREMASGLSMPVGFKNNTNGGLDSAINALEAAKNEHTFIGIDEQGQNVVVSTTGNPWGHIILRGGKNSPNYEERFVKNAIDELKKAELPVAVMVDASHANSNKKPENQKIVINSIAEQIQSGNEQIIGFMLEGNLFTGNQKITSDLKSLKYGVSVTDACLGWQETQELILDFYKRLS